MNMRTQSWRLKDGIGYKVDERGLTVRLRLQNLFVRYSTVYTAKMTSEIRQDRNNTAISMQPSKLLFNIVVNLNTLQRCSDLPDCYPRSGPVVTVPSSGRTRDVDGTAADRHHRTGWHIS
jgi:hypothetical protein